MVPLSVLAHAFLFSRRSRPPLSMGAVVDIEWDHSTFSLSNASLTGFEGSVGCRGGVDAGVSAIAKVLKEREIRMTLDGVGRKPTLMLASLCNNFLKLEFGTFWWLKLGNSSTAGPSFPTNQNASYNS